MPLIDREYNSNMLLINRKLAELEDDAEYISFLKLTELVKKTSKQIRTNKEKPYCLISHSLTCFVELVERSRFCFAEGLTGLTDVLVIDGAESREKKVAVGFS